jgi:outer membrane biosynthesis protein TonB
MPQQIRVHNPGPYEVVIDDVGHQLAGSTSVSVDADGRTAALLDAGLLLRVKDTTEETPAPEPETPEEKPNTPEHPGRVEPEQTGNKPAPGADRRPSPGRTKRARPEQPENPDKPEQPDKPDRPTKPKPAASDEAKVKTGAK